MSRIAEKAIVIGASMGGLMAARTLSDYFETVVVVERDAPPADNAPRKGVPQGRHAHGLLASGGRALEQMFPGFRDDIVAEGATIVDVVGECYWNNFGAVLARPKSDMAGFFISRPALENAVRKRVAGLPNVSLRSRLDAVGLAHDSARGRVTGLIVRSEDASEETIEADLVVDAGGRGARAPIWLERLGYPRPEESTVRVEIGYTTRHFRVSPAKAPAQPGAIINAGAPLWRIGAALVQHGERWIVTLGGYFGDRPPLDVAGFEAFAKSLPDPWIYNLIRDAEPIDEAASYAIPTSLRRRYEKLRRFPEGYLTFGDAICSFNPIYGQGMATAAKEALALRGCLEKGSKDLAKRFFAAASRVVDVPWQMAASADLANPKVEGDRSLQVRFLNWYVEKLFQGGSRDPFLATRFLEVANLVSPPTALLTPAVMWRVWRAHAGRRGAPSPLQTRAV